MNYKASAPNRTLGPAKQSGMLARSHAGTHPFFLAALLLPPRRHPDVMIGTQQLWPVNGVRSAGHGRSNKARSCWEIVAMERECGYLLPLPWTRIQTPSICLSEVPRTRLDSSQRWLSWGTHRYHYSETRQSRPHQKPTGPRTILFYYSRPQGRAPGNVLEQHWPGLTCLVP